MTFQSQETALYAEIGKQSLVKSSGQFPELESRLKLVQTNLTEAQARLKTAQAEKEQKEKEKQLTEEQCTCPECGHRNLEGVKFCQECGAELALAVCPRCGEKNALGYAFLQSLRSVYGCSGPAKGWISICVRESRSIALTDEHLYF